ncbi:MAG: hypothetical protein WD009_03680 [Phycisphaeraceae bacterium]
MHVYFTTVVRRVKPEQGGEIVCLDWDQKKVVARQPMLPTDPPVHHTNPRGGARGGRGVVMHNGHVVAAGYHTLHRFDHQLNEVGRIAHPLYVNLHELSHDDASLWACATSLDGLIGVGADGSTVDTWWPRETPALQKRYGLTPGRIDKAVDNRLLWLDEKPTEDPSHTHINAVCCHDGERYALLNRFSVVWAVGGDRPVIEDASLDRPHNLVHHAGHWLINNTGDRSVHVYDDRGQPVRQLRLLDHEPIARIARAATDADPGARPLFVRGLHVDADDRVWVGFSPASIAVFDFHTGALLDLHQHSDNVRACVHGLTVQPAPLGEAAHA